MCRRLRLCACTLVCMFDAICMNMRTGAIRRGLHPAQLAIQMFLSHKTSFSSRLVRRDQHGLVSLYESRRELSHPWLMMTRKASRPARVCGYTHSPPHAHSRRRTPTTSRYQITPRVQRRAHYHIRWALPGLQRPLRRPHRLAWPSRCPQRKHPVAIWRHQTERDSVEIHPLQCCNGCQQAGNGTTSEMGDFKFLRAGQGGCVLLVADRLFVISLSLLACPYQRVCLCKEYLVCLLSIYSS